MKEVILKETQGHKKMLQLVEDLKRNKRFLRDLKKYRKSRKSFDEDKFTSGLDHLLGEYFKLNDIAKRFFKKYSRYSEKIAGMM
ncbi:MAG: hypothetical protein AAB877_02185, partial [Patescibacteria group bacterium]